MVWAASTEHGGAEDTHEELQSVHATIDQDVSGRCGVRPVAAVYLPRPCGSPPRAERAMSRYPVFIDVANPDAIEPQPGTSAKCQHTPCPNGYFHRYEWVEHMR